MAWWEELTGEEQARMPDDWVPGEMPLSGTPPDILAKYDPAIAAQQGTAAAPVYRHSQQRVDQADRISTRLCCRLGNGRDVGHVGCQLGQHRQASLGPNRRDCLCREAGAVAEEGPIFHIWATEIEFDGAVPGTLGGHGGHFAELSNGIGGKT